MLSLLAKRNPCSVVGLIHRFCSSSETQTPNFMVGYLISSFEFSPDKAATVSKRIAHVKSPEKPDSVRHFLEHQGFTHAQIKTIIACCPTILCSSPQNTLEPNLRAIRDIGLSNSALTEIILSDSEALQVRTAVSRIKFCMDFLGGGEVALVRAFKANGSLAHRDIAPNISFLHSHGLSTHEIRRIVLSVPRFITCSPHLMEDLLHRAKELGFQPGSTTFVLGLRAVSSNSRETLLKKMELLKNFGWSENVFFSALHKYPNIVSKSEKNLQAKMDFLTGEVGCESSYIASNPVLLSYSLEKRVRPRHTVLFLLESKGLYSKGRSFLSSIVMADDKFVERCILPYKEEISGLHQDYLAACG